MSADHCTRAKDALDAAFTDGVKHLFSVLHLGLIDNPSGDARSKFVAGINKLRDAYDMACCAVAEELER